MMCSGARNGHLGKLSSHLSLSDTFFFHFLPNSQACGKGGQGLCRVYAHHDTSCVRSVQKFAHSKHVTCDRWWLAIM